MQVWRGRDQVPAGYGPCVVSLGVFDGVHRGHQALITLAVARAKARQAPCVVITFDPHPSAILRPQSRATELTTVGRRLELISGLGVDGCLVVKFTPQYAALSPEYFVNEVLIGRVGAAEVVVGANFTFGARGAGTATSLTELALAHGVPVKVLSLQTLDSDDGPVNSTLVRSAVAAGDLSLAARLLGRPHRLEGTLISAPQEVQLLDVTGYPALPADGSYPGILQVGSRQYPVTAELAGGQVAVAGLDPVLLGRKVILDFPGLA